MIRFIVENVVSEPDINKDGEVYIYGRIISTKTRAFTGVKNLMSVDTLVDLLRHNRAINTGRDEIFECNHEISLNMWKQLSERVFKYSVELYQVNWDLLLPRLEKKQRGVPMPIINSIGYDMFYG